MKNLIKHIACLAVFVLLLAPAVIGTAALAAQTISPEELEREKMLADERSQREQIEADEYYEVDTNYGAYETFQVPNEEKSAVAVEIAFYDAIKQWDMNGYPDDIGGEYYDSDANMMGILVVNPTQERIDELQAMFFYEVVITPCAYSYNELKLAQDEINSIMGLDSGIYSTGIGWTSTPDRRVHGFGESGKEFRLVVGVNKEVYEHYRDGFAALYGDRVVVEVSEPAWPQEIGDIMPGGAPVDDVDDVDVITGSGVYGDGNDGGGGLSMGGSAVPIVPVDISIALAGSAFNVAAVPTMPLIGNGFWLLAIVGVFLIGTLLLLLRLKSRPTPAMQTADGGIVVGSSAVSKKQVVEAVQNSTATPSDDLFDSIIQKIDSQDGEME